MTEEFDLELNQDRGSGEAAGASPFQGMNDEEIRLAGMRQAMFAAFSEAASAEEGRSFYDISRGEDWLGLRAAEQGKKLRTNAVPGAADTATTAEATADWKQTEKPAEPEGAAEEAGLSTADTRVAGEAKAAAGIFSPSRHSSFAGDRPSARTGAGDIEPLLLMTREQGGEQPAANGAAASVSLPEVPERDAAAERMASAYRPSLAERGRAFWQKALRAAQAEHAEQLAEFEEENEGNGRETELRRELTEWAETAEVLPSMGLEDAFAESAGSGVGVREELLLHEAASPSEEEDRVPVVPVAPADMSFRANEKKKTAATASDKYDARPSRKAAEVAAEIGAGGGASSAERAPAPSSSAREAGLAEESKEESPTQTTRALLSPEEAAEERSSFGVNGILGKLSRRATEFKAFRLKKEQAETGAQSVRATETAASVLSSVSSAASSAAVAEAPEGQSTEEKNSASVASAEAGSGAPVSAEAINAVETNKAASGVSAAEPAEVQFSDPAAGENGADKPEEEAALRDLVRQAGDRFRTRRDVWRTRLEEKKRSRQEQAAQRRATRQERHAALRRDMDEEELEKRARGGEEAAQHKLAEKIPAYLRRTPYESELSQAEEKKRRKEILRQRIVFVVASFALLFAQSIYLYLRPADVYSETEKRPLALFPALSGEELWSGSFMRHFETFANDQFPLRKDQLSLNQEMRRLLLQRDNGSVYFGADGYLFNKVRIEDDRQFYTNAQLLQKLDEELATESGVKSYFALAPNKEAVLTKEFPYGAPHRDQDAYQRLLASLCRSIRYVDLSAPLRSAEGQIFYYTDHHWTTRGAFVACNAFFEAAGQRLLYEDRFEKRVVKDDFLGSLYARSARWGQRRDSIELWQNKEFETDPNSSLEVRGQNDEKRRLGLYVPEALASDSAYDVFSGGEEGFLSFHTSYAQNIQSESLVVYKDSFADAMLPFLTQRFGHIYYIDPRFSALSIKEFLRMHPEVKNVLILMNFNSFAEEKNFAKLAGE